MRILSWIFQPVYLIFFVIIAVLYLYRAEIIPDHRDIEQSKALIARMEQTAIYIEDEYQNSVSDLTANVSSTSGEEKQSASPVLEQKALSLSDTDLELKSGSGESAAQFVEISQVEERTQREESSPQSLGELWYTARKSAMDGDIDQAIVSYIRLTSTYPQHADGFGELGNLYYSQDKLGHAITAYQQALAIYQRLGDSGESLQLQKIIAGLGAKSD